MATPALNPSNQTVSQEFIMKDIIGDISNSELVPSNVYSLLNSDKKPSKVKTNFGFKILKKFQNFTKKAYKEFKADAKSLGKKIIPPKTIETGLDKVEKISETGIKDIVKRNHGIKNFFTKKLIK
ncbi:hypothetical protein [Spiroplasma sp. Moj]|uniref:hypothetical protein n=1 Tax=Spiroplasma sp. Moj TaxID=1922342 RepID=UPI0039EF652E